MSLGLEKGPEENSLTICTTMALISLIRVFVSFSARMQTPYYFFSSPFPLRQRQGVNMVLLHVISNMGDSHTAFGIVPEFRINATKLEQTTTSYGGVIDYLIVNGPPSTISKYPIPLWLDVYTI